MGIHWRTVSGPHWHRNSIVPENYTAQEIRDEPDLVEESTKNQYESADDAMNVVEIFRGLVGDSMAAWAEWSVRSSTVRKGAVKFYRTFTAEEEYSFIYFPKYCKGGCNSHIEGS